MASTVTGRKARPVTSSDTVNHTVSFDSLYIGGAGNVVVVNADNTTTTFVGCLAGTVLPVSGKRINATGTTATSLVALS